MTVAWSYVLSTVSIESPLPATRPLWPSGGSRASFPVRTSCTQGNLELKSLALYAAYRGFPKLVNLSLVLCTISQIHSTIMCFSGVKRPRQSKVASAFDRRNRQTCHQSLDSIFQAYAER